MSDTSDALSWGNAHRFLLSHCFAMPGWHKLIIVLGLGLGLGGGIGTFTGGTPSAPSANGVAPATSPTDTAHTLASRISPQAMRTGFSVLGGFIVGWYLRSFIKTVTLLALLAGGILLALSYFRVINIDMSHAAEKYASGMHWLTDQGAKIIKAVIAHLPSTTGGGLGAFLGFRRK